MRGHPLGLGKHEWEVLRGAHHALSLVENGHFLPSPGRQAAALKLVKRGYLAHVDTPGITRWAVVKLTPECAASYNAALDAATAQEQEKGEQT